ncbi:MAG TPA: sigma-54 dependent transcriptional regulator [Bacteroidota bacterium]
MVRRYRILIADDEVSFTELLREELENSKFYDIDIAGDGIEAINYIQNTLYDVVLLDVRMPRVSGIEVLKFLQEHSPSTQVIILTNYSDVKTAIETIKLGAYDFISKPYDVDQLLNSIERALERRQLFIDNSLMKNELARQRGPNQIVGDSPLFKRTIESAVKVAQAETVVLIQGASGTGKELIAHLIHENSSRKDQPFVVVNCASIPDTLLESELFGHEKGSFTGAYVTKQGLAEVAHRGTLFLDEVGDISPMIQPKLLRFLESGEFRRVGGTNPLKVGVRIISATNKNLQEEVKAGRFREDLLYRLNVVTIQIPLLRDRKSDIPSLVDHFLATKARAKTQKKISPEALQVLKEYEWPGNIRELEHVIEGAVILSTGDVIEREDLTLNSSLAKGLDEDSGRHAGRGNDSRGEMTLEDMEKVHIEQVLRKNKGSRRKTAETLGISPKTLYLKIKKYAIKDFQ